MRTPAPRKKIGDIPRFFHMGNLNARIALDRQMRKCLIDNDREIALVAEHANPSNGGRGIIAVGRLARSLGTRDVQVAVLVTDHYQHGRLGTELLARLIQVARDERLDRVVTTILLENMAMRALILRNAIQVHRDADMGVVQAVPSP